MKPSTPLASLLCAALAVGALSLLPSRMAAQSRREHTPARAAVTPAAPASSVGGATLRILPASLALRNPYDERRALVEAQSPAHAAQDVSGKAELRLLDPRIATVDANGIVRPAQNGQTVLIARWGNKEARVPVVVSGMKNAATPRFVSDVMPVLTHAGCNQGACHGAASGKGGFKVVASRL